jgi:transposase
MVITPGKNRRTIFGAMELASGRWRYQVARKPSSATFTAFLEYLLVAYPVAPKVAVICDNTIIHRSQFVQRWLAAPARGGGVVRGTLQPHDNPVERVWRR